LQPLSYFAIKSLRNHVKLVHSLVLMHLSLAYLPLMETPMSLTHRPLVLFHALIRFSIELLYIGSYLQASRKGACFHFHAIPICRLIINSKLNESNFILMASCQTFFSLEKQRSICLEISQYFLKCLFFYHKFKKRKFPKIFTFPLNTQLF